MAHGETSSPRLTGSPDLTGMDVGAAYLAAPGFEAALEHELARQGVEVRWHGRLALTIQPPMRSAWALEVWTAPQSRDIPSIKAAARDLRAIQRNWAGYAPDLHRRSALIAQNLPPLAARPLVFPSLPPQGHLGAWTLLSADRMLLSPTKTSPFINGEVQFVEDRQGPPSRAYLKLWEAFTRLGQWPRAGETCLDLGASPGGWTWVAARCGADVIAIDRADLDPRVAALPGVTTRRESAFGLDPASMPHVDWLLSDIIAYPTRLLALARRWIDSGRVARMVLTIKFQGETDHDTAEQFAALPGGVVRHLWHNKHELTFFWMRTGAPDVA